MAADETTIHGSELLLTEETSAAAGIVRALADAGVRLVFGMPGGYTGSIFSALYDHPTIRVVQVREESVGSAAAEAYGRLTGGPAVVMGQGEWILGNAGQGLLEALLGSSPVIVLTEMSDGGDLSHHAPYQSGTGDYGLWDARAGFGAICKRVFVSASAAQAVQHTQLAVKHAQVGQPGPVAVIFEGRALAGRVGPLSHPRLYRSGGYVSARPRGADDAALRAAHAVIARAEHPVLLAGNGVRVGQACDGLALLAEALGAPVATTAGGKGVFSELHPQAAGVVGSFGNRSANAIVAAADVVVAVGTKLGPIDTGDENPALLDPLRQAIVHIDVEPLNAGWTYPTDHALVGDADVVMRQLAGLLGRCDERSRERVVERIADARDADTSEHASDDVPMHPQRVIRLLEEHWPENGVITCDAGENRLFMMQWFRSRRPGAYLQPAAGGGMGYAVRAAIGASIACPGSPVLAVCGDGGFSMSIPALMAAVQERLPICVVVFDNNALGWVLHGMGSRAVAADLHAFDHAAIARALGCVGVQVAGPDELAAALVQASTASTPHVIVVPTSLKTSFKDVAQEIASSRWRHTY